MNLFTRNRPIPVGQLAGSAEANLEGMQSDLNRHVELEEEWTAARSRCDELRAQLEAFTTDPKLVLGRTDAQIDAAKKAVESRLHDAMRDMAIAEQELSDHTLATGGVAAISARTRDLQMLQAHKAQIEVQVKFKATAALYLKLWEQLAAVAQDMENQAMAAFQACGDTITVGDVTLRAAAGLPDMALLVPPGMFQPARGNGLSCSWISAVKYQLGRYDPTILDPDDPVHKFLNNFGAPGTLVYSTWSAESAKR
jgi:hypothetical protein